MRKFKKYLISVFAVFILCFTFSTIKVSASGLGQTGGNAQTNQTEATEANPNASEESFHKDKTGYLVYLASTSGELTSDVVFVPYDNPPSGNIDSGFLKSRIGDKLCTKMYGGGISEATNGAFNQPALTIAGYGYGTDMKNALLQMSADGSAKFYDLIINVLGEDKAIQMKENDERLIVECVCWTKLEKDKTQEYLYTARGAAEFYDKGYTYFGKLFRYRMPNAGIFEFDDCGMLSPASQGTIWVPTSQVTGNYAWGMISFSPEDTIVIENPEENTLDTVIKANELNYIFPDLKKDQNNGRNTNTHSQVTNYGASDKWEFHTDTNTTTASALKDGKWGVTETITGDIKAEDTWYNTGAGTAWLNRDDTKTFLKSTTCVRPGYAFMYSRALMKDQITICDYKGYGNSEKDFIQNRLGLTNFGHNGGTGAQGFIGEARLADTASSYYKFVPYAVETWKERTVTGTNDNGTPDDTSDDTTTYSDWVDKEETHSNATDNYVEYDLTHGADKYTPLLISPPSLSLGETTNSIYSKTNANGAMIKSIYPANVGSVSLYPEVKYKMWIPRVDGQGHYQSPSFKSIYCMGEKVRSASGATLHGYTIGYGAESGTSNYIGSEKGMKGVSIIDSPMTGSEAFKFSDAFEGINKTQNYMQVCSQGSGFSVATTNNPQITVTSFALDLYDDNVSTTGVAFNPAQSGWSRPNITGQNQEFANAIANNLTTEVKMKRFAQNNNQVGSSDNMKYTISETKVSTPTIEYQIHIRVKNGTIIEGKTETIDALKTEYGLSQADANTLWTNWGIENVILSMLETKSNTNNSSSGKWYDEETECLAVSVCKSKVTLGNILINDKMDYGSSKSQNAQNYNNLGGLGYQCRFFFSLSFINPTITVSDRVYNLGNNLSIIKNDEILGARFLVSNATTNNWRK